MASNLLDDLTIRAAKPKLKPYTLRDGNGLFSSMVPKYVNNNSIEIIKVNSAINAICSIPNSPQRNALFVIASQILSDSIEDNPLGYEWHCKTDEMQSLSNKNNYALFVKMLEREIDFWQDFQKSRSNPPPKIKLQPSAQRI